MKIHKFIRIVSHEIKCLGDKPQAFDAIPSDSLMDVPRIVQEELQDNIMGLVGENAKNVRMEISLDSEAFHIVQGMPNAGEQLFIKESYKMAKKLAAAQSSSNTKDGVLLVIHAADAAENTIVLIIKAEFGKGFRQENKKPGSGKTSLGMLSDIILSDKKLYKIAAFCQSGRDPWECILHDHQMTASSTKAAVYFYKSFLELEFKEDDSAWTKKFFERTKEFVYAEYSGHDRVEMHNVLILYIKEKDILHSAEFASRLPEPSRHGYVAFMRDKGFTQSGFRKDTSRIPLASLKTTTMIFHGGISVRFPPEELGESFRLISTKEAGTIADLEGDWTFIGIKGEAQSKK